MLREKSVGRLLKPHISQIRELLAVSSVINLLALATPVFVLQIYDRVVFHGGMSTLYGLTAGMFLVIVFDFVLREARCRLLQHVGLQLDAEIGRRVFDKVTSLGLRDLEARPSAHWLRLFGDVDVVRGTVAGHGAILITDLPFVLFALLLIYVIASPLVWILALAVPLFIFVAWSSGRALFSAVGTQRQSNAQREQLLSDFISGRTTVKALGYEQATRTSWEELHADVAERALDRAALSDRYTNLGYSCSILTTVVMTAFGALAILNQELTIGSLIAANMLSGRVIQPLVQLVGAWRNFGTFRLAADRLETLFSLPDKQRDDVIDLPRPTGKISLQDIEFSYGQGLPPIFSNLKLTILPPGLHALVGANGSGKTTLLRLIRRLYAPDKGRVMLDDADLNQFTPWQLADRIGYAPQECFLFSGSIHQNIVMKRPDASDEEVIKAAEMADLHHAVIDLPEGYATDIGEAGRRLSAGQRQSIALARLFLADPPIMLLDEPSANLDNKAEEKLVGVLRALSRDHNIIVASHSPHVIACCDNIILLDKGNITLAGPAKTVLPKIIRPLSERRGAADRSPALKPPEAQTFVEEKPPEKTAAATKTKTRKTVNKRGKKTALSKTTAARKPLKTGGEKENRT